MNKTEQLKEHAKLCGLISICCSVVCGFCVAMYSGWLAAGLVFYTIARLALREGEQASEEIKTDESKQTD